MCVDIGLSGTTGFLGKVLFNEFIKSKYVVADINSFSTSEKIDIRKPIIFDSPPKNCKIFIHCAGKAHIVPKTKEDSKEFFDINLEGTKNLCSALEDSKIFVQSLIFISTVAVYGVEAGTRISESHPLNGTKPYSESKILAEVWLEKWAKERNVTLGILRLPLIVGSNPPGNLGSMIQGIKSGRYLSIGSGSARKSMVLAQDIAKIVPNLAERGGTYNLTDGFHPSFRDLEKGIAKALNKRIPLNVPYRLANGLAKLGDILGEQFPINSNKLKKITTTLTFDDSKARRELGWNPTPVLDKIDELVSTTF